MISFPFGIVSTFPLQAHCFCLISALCIVFVRYFHFCLSRFPLCKVSLPVAFRSYYMYLSRIEWSIMTALPLNFEPHFVFYYRFRNSLDFCCALHPKNYFNHFQGIFAIIKEIFFFKIPGHFKDKLQLFRIPGVFQDFSTSV